MSGGPDRKWRHTRPQLFGDSRAAVQARRAAGCAYRSSGSRETLVIGDPGSALNENPRPVTGWISTRKFIRRMARLNGHPARALSAICASYATERRAAFGLPPRKRHR